MIDGVLQLLKNTSAVTGLLGTDQSGNIGVYENELPRGYVLPAIAVHQYGGTQEYDFDAPVGTTEDQLQLDCYGDTSADCRAVADAVRTLLDGYVGTLPDGTVVQAIFKERDQAFPFLPRADTKGIANRWMLGFRVVRNRM